MKITIIVEGKTEKVFIPHLRDYLARQLQGKMPSLQVSIYDGLIPKNEKLRNLVNRLLTEKREPSDHVIALTDVYTGKNPPLFRDAAHAKEQMRKWVGTEARFHPQAALYEFEAWLLPYWDTIQKLAKHNKAAPSNNPETVNHGKPPAKHINEIFQVGRCRDSYVKVRDAKKILDKNDLSIAIEQCAELKSLVNTILSLCGGNLIP